jgi:hypothetical protein
MKAVTLNLRKKKPEKIRILLKDGNRNRIVKGEIVNIETIEPMLSPTKEIEPLNEYSIIPLKRNLGARLELILANYDEIMSFQKPIKKYRRKKK